MRRKGEGTVTWERGPAQVCYSLHDVVCHTGKRLTPTVHMPSAKRRREVPTVSPYQQTSSVDGGLVPSIVLHFLVLLLKCVDPAAESVVALSQGSLFQGYTFLITQRPGKLTDKICIGHTH